MNQTVYFKYCIKFIQNLRAIFSHCFYLLSAENEMRALSVPLERCTVPVSDRILVRSDGGGAMLSTSGLW